MPSKRPANTDYSLGIIERNTERKDGVKYTRFQEVEILIYDEPMPSRWFGSAWALEGNRSMLAYADGGTAYNTPRTSSFLDSMIL